MNVLHTKTFCLQESRILRRLSTNFLPCYSLLWSGKWKKPLIETAIVVKKRARRALSRSRFSNESTRNGTWNTQMPCSSQNTPTLRRWESLWNFRKRWFRLTKTEKRIERVSKTSAGWVAVLVRVISYLMLNSTRLEGRSTLEWMSGLKARVSWS